jgi:hypothetical protein
MRRNKQKAWKARRQCQVTRHADGNRTIRLNEEMTAALKEQLQNFREKFGREPGPHDPIFFDPDKDVPTPMDWNKVGPQIAEAMAAVGIEPAKIHAFLKTGLIPVKGNLQVLSKADLQEWKDACAEYDKAQRQ